MLKCIDSWSFDLGTPISRMAELCAGAGFGGVELGLSDEGELNLDSSAEECREALEEFRRHDIAVMTLTSNLFGDHHFASPSPTSRHLAKELAIAMLDRAMWLEAPVVQVMPAVVGWTEEGEFVSYETALRLSFEGLLDLAVEAEKRGVKIAVRSAGNPFILSPLEMRELIDRLNSPAFGVALNLNEILQCGFPEDWIRVLEHRLWRVTIGTVERVGPNESTLHGHLLDIPEILRALSEISYDGPLTYQGSGDVEQIARILSEWSDSIRPAGDGRGPEIIAGG